MDQRYQIINIYKKYIVCYYLVDDQQDDYQNVNTIMYKNKLCSIYSVLSNKLSEDFGHIDLS